MPKRRKMRVLVRHADWEWEVMENDSPESRAEIEALCYDVRAMIMVRLRGTVGPKDSTVTDTVKR